MPSIHVNGIDLYYEQGGTGEPILCIHGGGSSAAMWGDAIPTLAEHGAVIAYDRRGCSRSERPEPYEQTTVTEQADDAAALLDSLALSPAVVIARSYGGSVATDLALRYPEHVRALAMLEGDALGLSDAALEWTRQIRDRLAEVERADGIDSVYRVAVDEFISPGAWDSFPADVQQLLTDNGRALLADLHYVDEPVPGPDEFAAIEVPALIVVAEQSPAPQREMAEAMAEAMPNARLERIAGGHLIDPAAPPVIAFLDEVLAA